MKKRFVIFVLFFLFYLSTNSVRAYIVTDDFYSANITNYLGVDINSCTTTGTVTNGAGCKLFYGPCGGVNDCAAKGVTTDGYCNRSSTTTSCYNKACGGTSTLCCGFATAWTKYSVKCIQEEKTVISAAGSSTSYKCFAATVATTKVCSTADKWNSVSPYTVDGDSRLMRAGSCTCGVYSTYKACCDNGTLVAARKVSSDSVNPPYEALCPAGSSSFWNGGNAITLAWAQANCNNGACGATLDTCTTGIPNGINDGNGTWTCLGRGPVGEHTDASCSVSLNSPPVLGSLIIKNHLGTVVPVEAGNRNQICQPGVAGFDSSRLVTFEIGIGDSNGIGDISNITLTWNGKNIPRIGDIATTTTFGMGTDFDSSFDVTQAYPLIVTVTDSVGKTDVDSSRTFKIWDCKVPISGSIYDGSGGLTCPTTGFSTPANKDIINFTSLTFNGDTDLPMTIDPIIGVSYTSGSNNLIWGSNIYIPQLNTDIALGSPKMKSQSSSAISPNCDWYIDTTDVDPYSANPSFTADFSGSIEQESWWQATGGGAISNNSIADQVPITCITSNCKISPSGFVSSKNIINLEREITDVQPWFYSTTTASLANFNSSYSYFYDQYYVKNSTGTVLSDDKTIADIGSTGIYFVDGNLTIDNNKTVSAGAFLMIIVSGDININTNVTRIDGILVASNISAVGTADNQMVFNGSLYASNNIDLSRTYTNKSNNNTSPAVVVNHNPQMIFNLPGSVAKVLTSWQWGN